MCGVFAAMLADGRLCRAHIHRGVQALSHRGPDGEGIWLSDDGRVALGHRRLSIIGRSNGVQPLSNEDETIQACVNGEFYGFESLRGRLEQQGHRFRTQTDSEIVLHLYEEHGTSCLQFLRGEFAFIIWDSRSRRLFAARDRFGVKPLCYAQSRQGIYLASEAKAMFAAGLPCQWDDESFFHASAMQYLLPDRTLFHGVCQLPPGHYLIADSGNVTTHSYWELQFPRLPPVDSRPTAVNEEVDSRPLIEQCRRQVVEAVQSRLRSEVPLCFQLSGGLDSGAVLSIAASILPHPLDAFVISFDAAEYDEVAQARETAAACHANLHVVPVSQADLIECLNEAVWAGEGLAINGHLSAKFHLHRAIQQSGFKVVLTGEGADEVFAGYAHLRLDHWRFLGLVDLERNLAASNRSSLGMMLPYGSSLPLEGVRRRLGFVPAYLEAKATLGWRTQSLLRDEWLAEFRERDAFGELIDSTAARVHLEDRHPVNQAIWLWSKTALAGYILRTLGDGAEMTSSVEGRVPLLDHQLFEFVRRVPMSLKIRGAVEKYILREAVRPFVPDALYRRAKHPLDAPPLSLFSTRKSQSLLESRLRDKSFEQQPFFSPAKVANLLDRLPHYSQEDRQAWDPAIMMALATSSLHQSMAEASRERNPSAAM